MELVARLQDLKETRGTATGKQAEDLCVSQLPPGASVRSRLLREGESPALMVLSRHVDMVFRNKFLEWTWQC